MTDFCTFSRRLKIKIYFQDIVKTTGSQTNKIPDKLQAKSYLDPKVSSTKLESFQQIVTSVVLEKWDTLSKCRHQNFTKEERLAVHQLKQNETIMIKKTNKGGTTDNK